MKYLHLFMFFLSISSLGISQNNLEILVYEKDRITPIKGAKIIAINYKLDHDVTDDNGKLAIGITEIPDGFVLKYSVKKEGYEIHPKQSNSDSFLYDEYTIRKGGITKDQKKEITLIKTKTPMVFIYGKVRHKEKEDGIANVEIWAFSKRIAVTGPDGYFGINMLKDDFIKHDYKIALSFKHNLFKVFSENAILRGDKEFIDLQEIELLKGKNPELIKYAKQVTTINGQTWNSINADIHETGSSCYNNNESHCKTFGRLYTWEAAKKLCDDIGDGWHLPTEEEWKDLAKRFGGYKAIGYEKSIGDSKKAFKELSSKSNFNVLLGGYKSDNDQFFKIEESGYYWTSTEDSTNDKRSVYFQLSKKDGIIKAAMNKSASMSCRCVKK